MLTRQNTSDEADLNIFSQVVLLVGADTEIYAL